MPQTPAQKRARAKYQSKMPEAYVRAREKYDKENPVLTFRVPKTEVEQLEIIREAKEKLNAAARRVFQAGLEAMKGKENE